MKPLIAVIVLIFVAAVAMSAAGGLIERLQEPTYAEIVADQVRADQLRRHDELDAQWAPVRATVFNLVLIAIAVIVVGAAGALALQTVKHRAAYVLPNDAGLLPVVREDQATARAALAAYHQTRQIAAAIAPVPTHYAPHITYSPHHELEVKNDAPRLLPGDVAEPGALTLPGLTDLASLSFRPTRDAILLGLGEQGEQITVPPRALCHVALVGATGGGKSNLLRLLLPQLQSIGANVVLADPHYTPYDPESGDDWRPIARRLHMAPAVQPDEIDQLLNYLTEELERRLRLRKRGQKWGPPLFFAFDELPVIVNEVDGALDRIGKVVREGRKVHLLAVGASQTMLVKAIGGDSTIRDAYRTAFYVGGDLRSATALLDLPQREIDEGALTTGLAYLRSSATTPARVVRVPLASNAAIERLLGGVSAGSNPDDDDSADEAELKPSGSQFEATSEMASSASPRAEMARALALFRDGYDIPQIVRDLRGVDAGTGGGAYQKAAREIQALIREALNGGMQ